MTPEPTRNVFQQEDTAWSRAIELALTPVVAAGIGYLVDRAAGTFPLFTIVSLVLAMAGTFVKMFYAYDREMQQHEAASPWGKARARETAAPVEPAKIEAGPADSEAGPADSEAGPADNEAGPADNEAGPGDSEAAAVPKGGA